MPTIINPDNLKYHNQLTAARYDKLHFLMGGAKVEDHEGIDNLTADQLAAYTATKEKFKSDVSQINQIISQMESKFNSDIDGFITAANKSTACEIIDYASSNNYFDLFVTFSITDPQEFHQLIMANGITPLNPEIGKSYIVKFYTAKDYDLNTKYLIQLAEGEELAHKRFDAVKKITY